MRFPSYVPVAARRAKAARKVASLRKQGNKVQPVQVTGTVIARSFWGKRWCKHMESFSDYRNRLPRGRSYARHGAVCDLAIRAGRVDALVLGTRLYRVAIRIDKLKPAVWKSIKARCTGQIGSVIELLQGRLSDQVMAVVTDRNRGLFPTPRQIEFDCDCPDWAGMCKHVASVMYGVGARLDDSPELLFLLRKVDEAELIDADLALPAGSGQEDALAEDDLSGIFGIDLDTDEAEAPPSSPRKKGVRKARKSRGASRSPSRRKRTAKKAPARKGTAKRTPASTPFRPTGARVRRLRRLSGLSVAEFAARLGVTPATVYRWESARGQLNLRAASYNALRTLHERTETATASRRR